MWVFSIQRQYHWEEAWLNPIYLTFINGSHSHVHFLEKTKTTTGYTDSFWSIYCSFSPLKCVKLATTEKYTRICLKVCAPRFCFTVCALPFYSMVDWLIGWLGKTLFPFFVENRLRFRLHLCFIQMMITTPIGRLELAEFGRFVSRKHRFLKCADFEAYPHSQSINQPQSSMWVRRLWGLSSYSHESAGHRHHDWWSC